MKKLSMRDNSKRFFIVCEGMEYDDYVNVKICNILTNEEYINLDIRFKNTIEESIFIFPGEKLKDIIDLGGEDLLKSVKEAASRILF